MSFITRQAFTTSARRLAAKNPVLTQESKKNPELMILGAVMVATLGGAGYYFGSSPGKDNAEAPVRKAGMPWEVEGSEGKYKYHPGGDPSAGVKDAPSALNSSIIPDLNLPKELHEAFNKFGKE